MNYVYARTEYHFNFTLYFQGALEELKNIGRKQAFIRRACSIFLDDTLKDDYHDDLNDVIIISHLRKGLKGENNWGVDFGSDTGFTALTITAATGFSTLGIEVFYIHNSILFLCLHILLYVAQ